MPRAKQKESGFSQPPPQPHTTASIAPTSNTARKKRSAGAGARHTPKYKDTSDEYMAVRRSDLREIAMFSWLEHGLGAVGTFFISGAFWLLPVIFIEHGKEMKEHHWAWVAVCILSILFGGVLMWIARQHFKLRDQRIRDYFTTPDENA